jgi:hypothetical protein
MSNNTTPAGFIVSSDRNDGHLPYLAVDGNTSTYFRSGVGAVEAFWKIELPEKIAIWKYKIKAEYQEASPFYSNSFQLKNDQDEILHTLGLTQTATEYEFTISNRSFSKYFWLDITGGAASSDILIYDFRIYKIIF